MNKLLVMLCAAMLAISVTGCASKPKQNTSHKEDASQWEQFKAKKAQDELSSEIEKQ